MQRRGESGQPVKGRRHRAVRPKARKASTANSSIKCPQEQLVERSCPHQKKSAPSVSFRQQQDAPKALAEYRAKQEATHKLTAKLRAERLAREAKHGKTEVSKKSQKS
jgi:hypothetical protein